VTGQPWAPAGRRLAHLAAPRVARWRRRVVPVHRRSLYSRWYLDPDLRCVALQQARNGHGWGHGGWWARALRGAARRPSSCLRTRRTSPVTVSFYTPYVSPKKIL